MTTPSSSATTSGSTSCGSGLPLSRATSVSAHSVIGKATPIVAIVTTAAPGARNTASTITAITSTVSSSTRPIRSRIRVPCSIRAGVTPVTPTGAASGPAAFR